LGRPNLAGVANQSRDDDHDDPSMSLRHSTLDYCQRTVLSPRDSTWFTTRSLMHRPTKGCLNVAVGMHRCGDLLANAKFTVSG
jgi:hypothetical protein